jgi:hypothetical protein
MKAFYTKITQGHNITDGETSEMDDNTSQTNKSTRSGRMFPPYVQVFGVFGAP